MVSFKYNGISALTLSEKITTPSFCMTKEANGKQYCYFEDVSFFGLIGGCGNILESVQIDKPLNGIHVHNIRLLTK